MSARLRYACLLCTLTVAAVLLAGCAPRSAPVLRVATLNLAHGRGLATSQIGLPRETFEQNLRAVGEVLCAERPDVVALQEADASSAWSGRFDHVALLAQAAEFPYVHHVLHVDHGPPGLHLRYGTALLSRLKLANCTGHAFRTGVLDAKGYAAARVEFAGRPLTVVSVHLDPSSARRREQQAAALINDLRSCPGGLVIMGDFNTTWDKPDDGLRVIADALHLRAHEPLDAARATYPAASPRRRLDWILVSDDLLIQKSWECSESISDHQAVVAALEWR